MLGLTMAVPTPAHAAVDCAALVPAADAAANRVAIQSCLDGPERRAALTPGTYPVDGGIVVRSGAQLVGDATYPTIRLVANPSGAVRLVRFVGSGAQVGFLRLDANNLLPGGCCTAVVMFEGTGSNDNLLDDAFVTGAPENTGVYLLCGSCRGNQMLRVNIHGNFVRDFQILRNDIRNTNPRTIMQRNGDANRFFNANGAPRFSDVPGGGNGLIAFVLASWRTGTP